MVGRGFGTDTYLEYGRLITKWFVYRRFVYLEE
jgi:hypothetical protein